MPGSLNIDPDRSRSHESVIVDRFVDLLETDGDVDLASFLQQVPGDSARLVCDLILLDQQFKWRNGCGVKAEHYLSAHACVAADTVLCLDIIYGELRVRNELGETFTVEQWTTRFPELAGPIRKQLEVSQWWNAADDPATTTAQVNQDTVLRPAPADPEAPLAFEDFRLVKQLGDGAMGEVHLAVQKSLGKKVALKLLKHTGRETPERIERFLQEARIAASLKHPHLIEVHGVGRCHDDGYFLVMDFAQGRNLQQCLAAKLFTVEEAAGIVQQVAAAIHFAHERGIIHRDIKPGNVLYDDEKGVKVVDFGLAKHLEPMNADISSPSQIVGTPHFMAPEQADPRWGPVKPTTDVYSIGALLYTLITGHPPVQGNSSVEVLAQLVSDKPITPLSTRKPGVPAAIDQICRTCLQKDPSKRFATAAEVAQALQDFRTHAARRPWPATVPAGLWVAAATTLLLLVLAPAWWFWGQRTVGSGGQSDGASQVEPRSAEDRTNHGVPENQLTRVEWSVELFPRDEQLPPIALLKQPAPVHSGDKLQLRLQLDQPRYAYVFWLGSDGSVNLLHPVSTDADRKVREILLPADGKQGFPVRGEPGTEICVALIHPNPLPDYWQFAAEAETASRPPDIPIDSLLVDGNFYTAGLEQALEPLMRKLAAGSRPVGEATPLPQLAVDGWIAKWRSRLPIESGQLSYIAIPHR